jgi:hypothetical protein
MTDTDPAQAAKPNLKADVLAYIRENLPVSFANLYNNFEAFRDGGFNANLREGCILWHNMTHEACEAIAELLAEGLVAAEITSVMTYHIDGRALNLPIATGDRSYRRDHWLPTLLRPIEALPKPPRKRRGPGRPKVRPEAKSGRPSA